MAIYLICFVVLKNQSVKNRCLAILFVCVCGEENCSIIKES